MERVTRRALPRKTLQREAAQHVVAVVLEMRERENRRRRHDAPSGSHAGTSQTGKQEAAEQKLFERRRHDDGHEQQGQGRRIRIETGDPFGEERTAGSRSAGEIQADDQQESRQEPVDAGAEGGSRTAKYCKSRPAAAPRSRTAPAPAGP